MRDADCVHFLQWCLPRLKKRWSGFRKVRGQVCKRITRRMQALGLHGLEAYRQYLRRHPAEWEVLDTMCRITISRFYRDRGVFDHLRKKVLPCLAERAERQDLDRLDVWCAGSASGEEPYTLRIVWRHAVEGAYPGLELHLTATDADAHMLARARRACYQAGTLKELPSAWREAAFTRSDGHYCLRPDYRAGVEWIQQDIRHEMPDGPFHLVLCRNLVFTYFDEALQRDCLRRIHARLHAEGILVLGKHETLPSETTGFEPLDAHRRIYRRTDGPVSSAET